MYQEHQGVWYVGSPVRILCECVVQGQVRSGSKKGTVGLVLELVAQSRAICG
jgi:hypothetical protein